MTANTMKKNAKRNASILILSVCVALSQTGCAMMITNAVVKSQDREALAAKNIEREKAGLSPLTMDQYKNP